MMKKQTLCAIALGLLIAVPASADRADHAPKLMQLMDAIDTVPTRAQLEAITTDPTAELFAIAADTELHLYNRRRATSLLSAWPLPVVESYLMHLAATSTEVRLRWIAAYTYIRTFAPTAQKRVTDYAETWLKSPVPSDRDAAVRGLRHVPGDRAGTLLEDAEKRETDRAVRAAIKRTRSVRK
jgi:hypothetical protein